MPQFVQHERVTKTLPIQKSYERKAKIWQQKCRRVPIQLQDQVDKGTEKLLTEGHHEHEGKIQDDVFIQLTLITVKNDKSVKIALDATALNGSVSKNKFKCRNFNRNFNGKARPKRRVGMVFVGGHDLCIWTSTIA